MLLYIVWEGSFCLFLFSASYMWNKFRPAVQDSGERINIFFPSRRESPTALGLRMWSRARNNKRWHHFDTATQRLRNIKWAIFNHATKIYASHSIVRIYLKYVPERYYKHGVDRQKYRMWKFDLPCRQANSTWMILYWFLKLLHRTDIKTEFI